MTPRTTLQFAQLNVSVLKLGNIILHASLLVDQRKMIFYNKTLHCCSEGHHCVHDAPAIFSANMCQIVLLSTFGSKPWNYYRFLQLV